MSKGWRGRTEDKGGERDMDRGWRRRTEEKGGDGEFDQGMKGKDLRAGAVKGT